MKLFRKFIKNLILMLLISLVFISTILIIFKDYFMMPSAFTVSFLKEKTYDNCKSQIIKTNDTNILLWKCVPKDNLNTSKKIAIHFIGNAEILFKRHSDISKIKFLNSLGYTVYSANYRNVDNKKEKLSEANIKKDAESIVKYVSEFEQIDTKNMLISGYSIGTGVASYIANKFQTKILVLIAPYTSFQDIVREKSFYKYYINLVTIDFPTKNEIQRLKNTCVVITHGKKDKVIPYTHSISLKNLYKGTSKVSLILNDDASHINILEKTKDEIKNAILECEKQSLRSAD